MHVILCSPNSVTKLSPYLKSELRKFRDIIFVLGELSRMGRLPALLLLCLAAGVFSTGDFADFTEAPPQAQSFDHKKSFRSKFPKISHLYQKYTISKFGSLLLIRRKI